MVLQQEKIDYYARLYCEPFTLIMNFALFQYLCGMYYKRRSELRVKILLWFGFFGFVSLIPFANPDMRMFDHINDISETCSNMTFLTQIIIIGTDVARRVKIRSLVWLTHGAELLVVIGFILTLKSFIELFTTKAGLERFDGIDNIFEEVSLLFIFVFRFYYQAMSKGFKWLLTNRKLELLLYILFCTHEYPFLALNLTTGVSWESIQALWHRTTMTLCLLQTIREKFVSIKSKRSQHNLSQHQSTHHLAHNGVKAHASKYDSMQAVEPVAPTSPTAKDLANVKPVNGKRRSLRQVDQTGSRTATPGGSSRMPSLRSLNRQVSPTGKAP